VARERKRSKQRRTSRPAPVGPQAYSEAAQAFGEGTQEPDSGAFEAAPDLTPAALGHTFGTASSEPLEAAPGEDSGEIFEDELGEAPGSSTSSGSTAVATRQHSGIRAVAFLRASWAELQRVQWPDRRHVFQATAVVMGFVVVAGLFIGAADYVSQQIVNAIL
jgi:preprotein translocase SecE subunit